MTLFSLTLVAVPGYFSETSVNHGCITVSDQETSLNISGMSSLSPILSLQWLFFGLSRFIRQRRCSVRDRQTDRQTDRHRDRQTQRQTDRFGAACGRTDHSITDKSIRLGSLSLSLCSNAVKKGLV